MSCQAGKGYTLYAGETAVPKPGEKLYALRPEEHLWRTTLPFRPKAMVLAGATLFAAGPPDPAEPAQALAALEGERGGLLWAIATADGARLAERALDSPPVFDGIAAVEGRLFISGQDGRVTCLAGRSSAVYCTSCGGTL